MTKLNDDLHEKRESLNEILLTTAHTQRIQNKYAEKSSQTSYNTNNHNTNTSRQTHSTSTPTLI